MFKSGSEAQSASKAQSLGWTAQLDVYWHGRKQTMANNGHSKQSKKLFAMPFIKDSMMNLKTIPYFFLCKYVVWSLVVAQSITACLFKAVTFFRKIPWYPTFLEFSLITETLAIFFMANPKSEKKLARSLIEMNGNPLWNSDQMSFFEVDLSLSAQTSSFIQSSTTCGVSTICLQLNTKTGNC